MGSVVKFHISGDVPLIRKVVTESVGYPNEDFDIDYDNPEYEVRTCEYVDAEDYFNSSFAGETYYWDSENEEHIPWAGAPEDRHEEMIEAVREELNGKLFLLQVDLPHENGDGATTLSIFGDEFFGYVEVHEIWHHSRREHAETRGLLPE